MKKRVKKFFSLLTLFVTLFSLNIDANALNKFIEIVNDNLVYERVYGFVYGMTEVWEDDKKGYINQNGIEIVEPSYDYMELLENGNIIISKDNSYGLLDKEGNVLLPMQYTYIYKDYNTLRLFEYEKAGVSDLNGKIIIPVVYNFVGSFWHDLAIVSNDGKAGIVNYEGQEVVPVIYDEVIMYGYNHLGVMKDQKWGIIDLNQKEIIPLEYDLIRMLNHECFFVSINGKWGVLDSISKQILPIIYDEIAYVNNELFRVKTNEKWSVIDVDRNNIFGSEYDSIKYYDSLYSVGSNTLFATKGNQHFVLDEFGNEIIKYEYLSVGYFYSLDSIVQAYDGTWYDYKVGFIDISGTVVIPMIYDYTLPFVNELAMVKLNEKWGLIDKTGQVIVPIKYDLLYNYNNDYIYVELNGKRGLLDKTGQIVVPVIYDELSYDNFTNIGTARKGDKWTVFKLTDNVPSPWAIDEISKAIEEDLITKKITSDYKKDITREEFCEMMVNLYEKLSGKTVETVTNNPFTDTDNQYILKAHALGIVFGVGNNRFNPDGLINRQQFAVMLYRTINAVDNNLVQGSYELSFDDNSEISSWAKEESMAFITSKKILTGVGNNRVAPRANATRQQALALVLRTYEAFK